MHVNAQKMCYLLKRIGINIGNYSYSWNFHGPFSPGLLVLLHSLDSQEEDVQNYCDNPEQPATFSNDEQEKITSLIQSLHLVEHGDDRSSWMELLGALAFLSHSVLPGEDFAKGLSGSDGMHHEYMGCQIISMNHDIYRAVHDNSVLLNINGRRVLNPKFAIWKKGDSPCTSVDEERVGQITSKLLWAIGEMVRGNYENGMDELYPWLEKYSAMIQIIHSDIDADNFDYLMRDATFSGTSYGLMDMGVLLNCLVVCPLKQDSTGKAKYIIGVQKKGVGCVEQFLLNKFLAYSQTIFECL